MSEADSKTALRALMERYFELFNASDFGTALSECYNLPFSWLVGPAADTVLTPEAFVARMSAMRSSLADAGLTYSELLDTKVRMMGPNAALIGVVTARHYGNGKASEVSGATYVAHLGDKGWRLALLIAHPVQDIVD
ncbi:nuclear transport factor 2 family protein [Novosphingobium taihuense]|uniref:DUF6841 domain-containing protein n=1 Tax=Novosphingobium taihuense TaxID=260085 RepID=A0A7W7EUD6_9SPHN|nr:nuclear transport factor 2 family protein [Novosphingobium taihuense]MBB4614298.1 hypothetical protein [Novosphingobium taihuense]TWH87145.1 uncharacterized protein DUF4440 [Novosphingobium taihuense]